MPWTPGWIIDKCPRCNNVDALSPVGVCWQCHTPAEQAAELRRFEREQKLSKLKKRQRIIVATLRSFGGTATTRQVAEKLGLSVNGVAQSLWAIKCVQLLESRKGDSLWKFTEEWEDNRPVLQ